MNSDHPFLDLRLSLEEMSPFFLKSLLNLSFSQDDINPFLTFNNDLEVLDIDTTEIDLGGRNLITIPVELKRFKNLEVLNLGNNNLSNPDELREFLEALPNLRKLDLEGNLFKTFPIVPDFCVLTHLYLANNNFKEIPESLKKIQTLHILDMQENSLFNIPEWIEELTELYELDLSDNHIQQLPDSINNLKNLITLILTSNQLTEIPSLEKLTALQNLCLQDNHLTEFPDSILNLHNLSNLELGYNEIRYLPYFGVKLANLSRLLLIGNPIENITLDESELIKLEQICLSSNQLGNLSIAGKPNLQLICSFLTQEEILETAFLVEGIFPLEDILLENQIFADTVNWPRKYWGFSISNWKPQWLFEEKNTEIRRILIQQIGYDKICTDLDAELLDEWREYCLLKIPDIDIEDVYLLKMTCPSTGHIHVTRVPPTVASAQEAITWINHGIDPTLFQKET